jgi:hypothetical protein
LPFTTKLVAIVCSFFLRGAGRSAPRAKDDHSAFGDDR